MENTENMELLENGQDEEKMTLEKFEDATEEVKRLLRRRSWFSVNIIHRLQEIRFISNRKICSIPAHIRCGALITKSVRFQRRKRNGD